MLPAVIETTFNFFEHTVGRDAKTSCPCPGVKLSLTIFLDTGAIGVSVHSSHSI